MQRVMSRMSLDIHMKEILRAATTALSLKVFAAGLAFAFNVVLARMLGADQTGFYFICLALATICSVIGRLGLDDVLVKVTSANKAVQSWQYVYGHFVAAIVIGGVGSTLVGVVLFFSSDYLAVTVFDQPQLVGAIKLMALAVLPVSIYTLASQGLKGLRCIKESLSVLNVFAPLVSLAALPVFVAWLGLDGSIVAYVVGAYFAAAIGIFLWYRRATENAPFSSAFNMPELLGPAPPLFIVSVMQLIINWSSVVFLGIWADSADAGIFRVANRTAMLTSFIFIAIDSISAPKFAEFIKTGNLMMLRKTARQSCALMASIAGPVLALFLFFPEFVMSVFGHDFVSGATVLAIIAVGQFVNVATGSVASLLVMSGNERLLRNDLIVSAILNLLLGMILIPKFGSLGAAIGLALTIAFQNLYATYLVYQRLGFWTIPFFGRQRR